MLWMKFNSRVNDLQEGICLSVALTTVSVAEHAFQVLLQILQDHFCCN